MSKRYISLDISTNTGYAIFENNDLLKYGLICRKVHEYKADVKSYRDFPEVYPRNFMAAIDAITNSCMAVIQKNHIDMVIIEHPEKGKQRLSQRFLEWTHLALLRELERNQIPYKYILVSDWRAVVKCYIKYWPEWQDWNKIIRKAKKQATPTKTGRKLAKVDGRRASAMDQKKLSILIANQYYNLELTDNNIADAVNIGRAANELGIINL